MNSKDKVKTLAKELDRLGLSGESNDVNRLTVKMNPLDVALALGKIKPDAWLDAPDVLIDEKKNLETLETARKNGFSENCIDVAIAINDILFYGDGRVLIAKDGDKQIYAVEYDDKFWTSEGIINISNDVYKVYLDQNPDMKKSLPRCSLDLKIKILELAELENEKNEK